MATRRIDSIAFTATETGDTIFPLNSASESLLLTFKTTGTFSVRLYGSVVGQSDDDFKPLECYKRPNYDIITETISDDGYMYVVDVTGIDYLKFSITAISGSLVTNGKIIG